MLSNKVLFIFQHISANELFTPAIIFIILSILHSHIVATQMPTSSNAARRNALGDRRVPRPSKKSTREDESQSSSEGEERLRFRGKNKASGVCSI